MTFLQMNYFVQIAHCENISKVAEKNFISQPALSQQLHSIEAEIGLSLFHRINGRLSLTSAGAIFCQACDKILSEYELAITNLHQSYNQFINSNNQILCGLLTSSTTSYFERIVPQFNTIYPNINIILSSESFSSMRNGMIEGRLNLCICPDYNLENISNVTFKKILIERLGLLVSKKNPLAQKDNVFISDIRDENIIMTSKEWGGLSYSVMGERRKRDGHTPKIVATVDSGEAHSMMVDLNYGSAFLPERLAEYDHSKSKMLHIIDGTDVNTYVLGWQKDITSQPFEYLIKLIINFFQNDFEDWIAEYLNNK